MTWIVPFSQTPTASIAEVGGKGHSLIRLAHAGLPIPPGFVLAVHFFDSWFAELRATEAWAAFAGAAPEDRPQRSDALKAEAYQLRFSSTQREHVATALRPLASSGLFAVRSSSPEEDLAGSSFAGGYETVLGVRRDRLEEAVVRAFTSCLDARVVVYKSQHGFDPLQPTIAVVVQQQIASEVAGVGFSLNPITNDFDEAVYSANWGLGETVVGGHASPDFFRVDKRTDTVLERQVGAKETALWLGPDGGTLERVDRRHDQLTLSDAQLVELTGALRTIEALYGCPMDIEWAYASGVLYLLQGRPVTTHVPLHPDMTTDANERRYLYLDATIAAQGVLEPLTPMADAVFRQAFTGVSSRVFGFDITASIATTVLFVRNGRLYMNLSSLIAVAGSERITRVLEQIDSLSAAALREADPDSYRSESFKKARVLRGGLRNAPRLLATIIRGLMRPEKARARAERRVAAWLDTVKTQVATSDAPLSELAHSLFLAAGELIFFELIPLVILARRSVGKINALFADAPAHIAEQLHYIDQALPGNVTVEMGLALDRLGELLGDWPAEGEESVERLQAAIAQDAGLPAEFLSAWRALIERYGHRAIKEIEIAQPRNREAPALLLQQILQMRALPREQSSRAMHTRGTAARQAAFAALREYAEDRESWLTNKRIRMALDCIEHLGGLRETHKYCLVYAFDLLRTRIVRVAEALCASGRLDRPDQVWNLTLSDLDEAENDEELDLRARAAERRAPMDRLAQVPELPRIIDSRGHIWRAPPPPAREGELVGQPISAGVVRGVVKVLHAPDEKPLAAGEILVARATDPGWTPLFVPAAAIVLEVGGVLQHGALVAREYGKPCVAGIARVTDELRDGMLVEVDGAAGVVRLVS